MPTVRTEAWAPRSSPRISALSCVVRWLHRSRGGAPPPSLGPPAASALAGISRACLGTRSPAWGADAGASPAGGPLPHSRRTSLRGVFPRGAGREPAVRCGRAPGPPSSPLQPLRRERATQTPSAKGASQGGSGFPLPECVHGCRARTLVPGPMGRWAAQRGRPPPCLGRPLGLAVDGNLSLQQRGRVPERIRVLAPLQGTWERKLSLGSSPSSYSRGLFRSKHVP